MAELDWTPEFGLLDGLADSYQKDFGRGTYRKEPDFTTGARPAPHARPPPCAPGRPQWSLLLLLREGRVGRSMPAPPLMASPLSPPPPIPTHPPLHRQTT